MKTICFAIGNKLLSEETYNDIIENKLSFLSSSNERVKSKVMQFGAVAELQKGALIFDEGAACTNLAIVLSGKVRVFKLSESGREITIYRINEGESCILTISSILSDLKFPATAVVEEDLTALMLPSNVFKELVDIDEKWRNYTFRLVNQRLANVITIVEEVAFGRMDERIAEFLMSKINDNNYELNITHKQIADELGTHREVVSRILKDFEKAGFIQLARNRIKVLHEII